MGWTLWLMRTGTLRSEYMAAAGDYPLMPEEIITASVTRRWKIR